MAQSDIFRRVVLDDYGRLLSSLFQLIDEVAFATLDQRLARMLVAKADSKGEISATHQQLADDLGSVREVVTRRLGEWERAGLVRTGRGSILIVDRAALACWRGG
jgi:CRP/FNR family transcriptional regulator